MPLSICADVSANWPEKALMTPILIVSWALTAPGNIAATSKATPANSERFIISSPKALLLLLPLQCLTFRAKKSAANRGSRRQWLGAWLFAYKQLHLGQGQGRALVLAVAHLALREDAVGRDPLERLFVHFLGIGLEHQPLAGSPAPGIHLVVEAVGEFLLVIMSIELGPQVDVALRLAQGAEELAQVFGIGIAVDHGADHEGAVDHLPEAELLGEVIRPAEQVHRWGLALEQLLHPREQHAVGI